MLRRSSVSMSRPSAVCVWPCRRSRINSVMRCWVSKTVRRRVSVGCAVITGDTSAPVSVSATVAESRSAESSLQVGGGQAAVLRRLARCDMDGAAALTVDVLGDVGQQREMGEGADDRDGLVDVDAVEHVRRARRGRSPSGAPGTTPTRARSTRSNTSSPFCSRTVSPRMVPSSRMSSRIGSVASRPTLVRRTEPIGASEVSGPSAITQVSATRKQRAGRERRCSDHGREDREKITRNSEGQRNRRHRNGDADAVVLLRADTERAGAERPQRGLVLEFGDLTRTHIRCARPPDPTSRAGSTARGRARGVGRDGRAARCDPSPRPASPGRRRRSSA